jgi:hypothetical protein
MNDKVIDLAELHKQERDQDLALLSHCETLTSQGAKRDFCESINCPWDEYKRLCRKYKTLLKIYRKAKAKVTPKKFEMKLEELIKREGLN